MAIRVCKTLQITGTVLSHKITKLVAECAKDAVACILHKQKVDTLVGRVALSAGKSEGEMSKRKCHTFSHDSIANQAFPSQTT